MGNDNRKVERNLIMIVVCIDKKKGSCAFVNNMPNATKKI